jgi:hypothetical protein
MLGGFMGMTASMWGLRHFAKDQAELSWSLQATFVAVLDGTEFGLYLAVRVGAKKLTPGHATRPPPCVGGSVPPVPGTSPGPRLDHQAVTWLLERYGSPAALRKAGRRKLVEVIRSKAPRMATRLIDDVFEALDEQIVVVPGTGTLDIVIPSLTRSLRAVHEQRRAAQAQITALLEEPPLMQFGVDASGPSDR